MVRPSVVNRVTELDARGDGDTDVSLKDSISQDGLQG